MAQEDEWEICPRWRLEPAGGQERTKRRARFPSSWTWAFLLRLPLDFRIVACLVLRLRIWMSSPRALLPLVGTKNDAINFSGSHLAAPSPESAPYPLFRQP